MTTFDMVFWTLVVIGGAVLFVVLVMAWMHYGWEYSWAKKGGSNYETKGTLSWAFNKRGNHQYQYKKVVKSVRAADKKRRAELRAMARVSKQVPPAADAMDKLGEAAKRANQNLSDYAQFVKDYEERRDGRIENLRRRKET